MKKIKFLTCLLILILVIPATLILFSGCGKTIDIDTTGMYLVIYDGNGGYLGNKFATVRKLFCNPGSKIPDYPTEYSENQYTVSSLGLAMKDGYQLLGWYASDDVQYSQKDNGEYVKLENGNGVYTLNANGTYVKSYVESPEGQYVYVFVEEFNGTDEEAAEVKYVFIDNGSNYGSEEAPSEEDTAEGEETTAAEICVLPIDSGFYICSGESDITEIDDDDLREAYRKAFETKTYTKSQVDAVKGWQAFDELDDGMKATLSCLAKNRQVYKTAEAGEEGLDHYSVEADYASLTAIFVDDPAGEYVLVGTNYVKYEGNIDAYVGKERYSIADKYVFNATEGVESPSFLQRYDAAIQYWNFAEDKVTQDKCTWDGEKYVMTLYAHWVKKNTVYYHYENGTGQIDEYTTRLLADKVTYVNMMPGDIIYEKEGEPLYANHTFIGWSKSKDSYEPWDFVNDLFPEGASEVHLYAYYIEGTYTRIVSAKGLEKVAQNPSGNYMLAADIDLGGKTYTTTSPLGLSADSVFTGKFLSFGKTIKNFSFNISATKQQTLDASKTVGIALFPQTRGAEISGLNVEGTVKFSGLGKSTGETGEFGKKNIQFFTAGLIGNALEDTDNASVTKVSDCNIKLTCTGSLSSNDYNYVISVGDVAAQAGAYEATGIKSEISADGITGSVTIKTNYAEQ